MHEYPYPYDQPNWTAIDQRYWFRMCRTYRYPIASVRDPYKYLIQSNQDATWEADYQRYQDEQASLAVSEPV